MASALREIAPAEAARDELDAFWAADRAKSLLRFITCGSVDDGKSTLIGRLLYDSRLLFDDQAAAMAAAGRDGRIDFASLVDGLSAEREQGITIDVAYRFFATANRKFIVADTPGHEQYTRNMATGASTADLAVILIDARKGVLTQTRRHSFIANLLGIRRLVLAVNKMDLVGYDQARFEAIVADYAAFAAEAGIGDFVAIPISGLEGDNVIARSDAMPWYEGPALLDYLDTVPVSARREREAPLRLPVQWVNRPHLAFRGYAGTIAAGRVRVGDAVTVLPAGTTTTVARIVTFDGDRDEAGAGEAVTVTLADEVDCSRGDMIAAAAAPPRTASALTADLVWLAAEPLAPQRAYWLKIGTQTVSASVRRVRSVVDIDSLARQDGGGLALNDIGTVEIALDRRIAAATYAESRRLGGFILIDKISNATVAAGMVRALAEAAGATGEPDARDRIVWITGATSAERAAAAGRLRERLAAAGRPHFVLDEAVLRAGLNSDQPEPGERARRVREAALLLSAAGVQVLVTAAVAPDEAHPGRVIGAGAADVDDVGEWVI